MPIVDSAISGPGFVRARPCSTWAWCAYGEHNDRESSHHSPTAEVAVRTADHRCAWTRDSEELEPCPDGISAQIFCTGDAPPDIILWHGDGPGLPTMTADAAEDLAIDLLMLARQARQPRSGD